MVTFPAYRCGHRGTHITIRCQHGSRNIHAPSFTVGIHRVWYVSVPTLTVTASPALDFIADLTGDRYRLTDSLALITLSDVTLSIAIDATGATVSTP
ncbi:hypothetical protein [Pectobacterium parvum]|uniref:hypothetical protein n=1 Tax=Pectobacterium parvum TaxID=2778550 RepID=UPI001FD93982|nr:hypothetical protein [Pectobacterium parvum]